MYRLFHFLIFLMLTFSLTEPLKADYRINNDRSDPVWVAYSTWQPSNRRWPEGFRTTGWYPIHPGSHIDLSVPAENHRLYIRVETSDSIPIQPINPVTRFKYPFWVHPSRAFAAVQTVSGALLTSSFKASRLKQEIFYVYLNSGEHTIFDAEDESLGDLPKLSGEQIYDVAVDSLIWIRTNRSSGSGVLIDQERRLAVTNAHVTANNTWVDVVFPKRRNAKLEKKHEFYKRHSRSLENQGYITRGHVIARSNKTDLVIIQLDRLPPTAREIRHDFDRHVEASMHRGDALHILGNPGERLWNSTQGSFVKDWDDFLEIQADVEPGNSGGPVINAQGMLIGIIFVENDETFVGAIPVRMVKALLDRLRPRHKFRLINQAPVRVDYQVKWAPDAAWKNWFIEAGFILTHTYNAENVEKGYPKIRFDNIPDTDAGTTRTYTLDSNLLFLRQDAETPTYRFQFARGKRLDLFKENAAAPIRATLAPNKTDLLPNFPNPFNPETWIPYHLAETCDVRIRIYDAQGILVRVLPLGHQIAGYYTIRSRAAYWDARNALGEPVASGVYFYTLTAGDFTATRKMLILK